MKQQIKPYTYRKAYYIALAVTVLRVFYLYLKPYDLFFDEAQYWTWSESFEWGYFSKPPFIGWLIMMSTAFGKAWIDGTFLEADLSVYIRLAAPIAHFFTSLVIFRIGLQLYDSRVGFWSSITYLTLPAVTASSYFISADAPLMLFWALGMYCFILALEEDNDKWWILMGVWTGFGLLTKYTMAMMVASTALYLFTTPKVREYLYRLSYWAAGTVAFCMFLPNLFWNEFRGYVSFVHTQDNMFSNGYFIYPIKVLEFIGGQFVVFGFILFPVLVVSCVRVFDIFKEHETKMLASFIFPLACTAVTLSLVSGAQAHWAAPVYVAGTVMAVNFLLKTKRINLLKISLGLNIIIAVIFLNFTFISDSFHIKTNPFSRIERWNNIAPHATKALNKYPNTLLLSDERKAVATLKYNLRSQDGKSYTVMKWNGDKIIQDHYDMTQNLNKYIGYNFILVTRTHDIRNIAKYFDYLKKVEAFSSGDTKFYLYYLQNFKGY